MRNEKDFFEKGNCICACGLYGRSLLNRIQRTSPASYRCGGRLCVGVRWIDLGGVEYFVLKSGKLFRSVFPRCPDGAVQIDNDKRTDDRNGVAPNPKFQKRSMDPSARKNPMAPSIKANARAADPHPSQIFDELTETIPNRTAAIAANTVRTARIQPRGMEIAGMPTARLHITTGGSRTHAHSPIAF